MLIGINMRAACSLHSLDIAVQLLVAYSQFTYTVALCCHGTHIDTATKALPSSTLQLPIDCWLIRSWIYIAPTPQCVHAQLCPPPAPSPVFPAQSASVDPQQKPRAHRVKSRTVIMLAPAAAVQAPPAPQV